MRLLTLSVLLLTLTILDCKAQSVQKFNLNFETPGEKKNLAKGWFKWGNYSLSLDTSVVYSGNYAAQITSDSSSGNFGSVAYKIPANYKGETITLRGFMKIKDVKNGTAGLLLRINGGGKTLAFENMNREQIRGTKDWKQYSITLTYPEEAENIYLGGILIGKGQAWFDDFELTIDGKNVENIKYTPAKVYPASKDKEYDSGSNIEFNKLTSKSVGDLALLGKVWGFLKYYHPEIAKGEYNWDYELFRFLPKYLDTKTPSKRNATLASWIDTLGIVQKCKNCSKIDSSAHLQTNLLWIENSNLGSELRKKLNFIFKNRQNKEHYYVRLTNGVKNPSFLHEDSYTNMSYPDDGFRLLSLFRYWNMIQYFFPYRQNMDKDWDHVLKEYIPTFIKAENELEYELAVLQIIADVQDTHANLWGGGDKINNLRGHFYPPFHVRFIEEKLVLTDYYNPGLKKVAGLEVGDIITHINNKPVKTIVDSLKPFYPASNQVARLRNMSQDLLRSDKEEISIQYESSEESIKKNLALYEKDSLNYYSRYQKEDKKSYKVMDGNIGYVTLESIKDEDVPKIKNSFKSTDGIIIDIRNYPSAFVPFKLGSFFVSSSTPFAKFTKGSITTPGEFTFSKPVKIPASSQTYKGKLVVIVNSFTQSQAEYTAMAFRAGQNTTVIGNTTAGADGNISTIMLPGGLRTLISGIGVYYPDGKPTQRIGIVPDVEVKPTIKGIRDGKDELLQKAIEIINN